jgi:23S rRNA (cytidine1920-2'-O)/16S rRNA (cytidine1409-2'-O)-methyltransferase
MFASRAGDKLQYALEKFNLSVSGKICADLGCSTGGFTSCLIANGAKKVFAVDTGYGVLDWNLRNNPRVVVMERINALHVRLPEEVDFISIDVGWTPQRLIIPHALELLSDAGDIVSLLKPHYEAPHNWLSHGKVYPERLPEVVESVQVELKKNGVNIVDIAESPVVGQKGGNVEYLMWIRKLG